MVLSWKFWSGKNFGPGAQNSWKIDPLDHYFLKIFVRAWSERKYLGVSTFKDTFMPKCLYSIMNPKLTCVVGHSPFSLSIVYAELVCFVSWIVQLAL